MGDAKESLTCVTFQYQVLQGEEGTSSSNAPPANSLTTTNNNGEDEGGSTTSTAATTTTTAATHNNNSSAATGKTGVDPLHEKVALLCESIAKEFNCTVDCTPFKTPSPLFHQQQQLEQQQHLHPTFLQAADGSLTINQLSHDIHLDPQEEPSGMTRVLFSITVTGPFQGVMSCKQSLIRRNPSMAVIIIKTIRNIILTNSGEMKPVVKKRLDDLKQATGTQITCLGLDGYHNNSNNPGSSSALTPPSLPEIMEIEIVGEMDAVERTRLLALALLDELFGLSVMQITLAAKYHPIVAGRKRELLNRIMHSTRTNFYFPIPFVVSASPATSASGGEDTYHNTIYITGQPDDILDASRKYLAIAQSIDAKLISRQIACLHRKLDWLYSFRKDKIRKIMADNAVNVTFPPPGSTSNIVTISGTQNNLVDRAIRSLKQLICDCYLASVQASNPVETPELFLRLCQDMGPSLTRTNALSGAEIMINRNIIEIYGSDIQAKQSYQDLTSIEALKIRDTKFQIELSLEHRDFINGKKNGKINRITKTSGCRVAFQENPLDVNMMIDLYSAVPSCLLLGVSMLEEELPAEMSFHIPEIFHKRIIGVGGKNIQKIMKRYGVYVKFSSLEEYEQLGGYYENADNVICRTPSKNSENLRDLKASIVEAVNATDLLETISSIDSLPRQLCNWYVGVRGEPIVKMSVDLRVRIYLPDRESGNDTIRLEGPESSLAQVKERLKATIPFISDFQVPCTPALSNMIKLPEFLALKQKLRRDFEMVIWIAISPPETEFDFSFYLFYPNAKLNYAQFEEAKQLLVTMFTDHQVPFSHVARSESYANLNAAEMPYDSFQHFNSKLLAPVAGNNPASSTSLAPSNEAPASRNNTSPSFNNNLYTGSAPSSVQNIRHLFDDASSNSNPATGMPPGLQRSGSDIRPKATSVLGRAGGPSGPSSLRQKTEYLRHSTSLTRPALTMPDLSVMNVSKSSSMTDIMQVSLNDAPPTGSRAYPWGGGSSFSKSLSSSAIVQDQPARASNSFTKASNDYANLVSPTDIEFDQKMEDQVQALDKQNSDESDQDADLKELGIKALGSRKKILAVIKKETEHGNIG